MDQKGPFSQFIDQEATPYIRDLLLKSVREIMEGAQPCRRKLEFNLFEVTLDAESQTVLIESVLDASENGSERVPLAAFLARLDES